MYLVNLKLNQLDIFVDFNCNACPKERTLLNVC